MAVSPEGHRHEATERPFPWIASYRAKDGRLTSVDLAFLPASPRWRRASRACRVPDAARNIDHDRRLAKPAIVATIGSGRAPCARRWGEAGSTNDAAHWKRGGERSGVAESQPSQALVSLPRKSQLFGYGNIEAHACIASQSRIPNVNKVFEVRNAKDREGGCLCKMGTLYRLTRPVSGYVSTSKMTRRPGSTSASGTRNRTRWHTGAS